MTDCGLRREKKLSKKQAVNPVKASATLDPAAVIERFKAAGANRGFRVHTYGAIGPFPLIALTRRTAGPRPRVYLSAASHGDEPAGPATLLQLLETGYFDTRANWFLCPMLNPVGISRGIRENGDGVDLNRDYRGTPKSREVQAHVGWLQSQPRFDLVLCLHEDWEAVGFYLYELNPDQRPSAAEAIVSKVSQVCPIDRTELIDGRPAKDGIIRPIDDPQLRELWPEAIYLRAHHTSLVYTTETPSAKPLEQRIAAQCVAVDTAVRAVLSDWPLGTAQPPSSL